MKVCNFCRIEKSESQFYLCKSRNGTRLHSNCISCGKIIRKNYYRNNREISLEKNKIYNIIYPDKAKETRRRTYLKHHQSRLNKSKIFREKYPILIKERNKNKYIRYKQKALLFFINLLKTYPSLITYIAKIIEIRNLNAKIARTLRGRINKKLRNNFLKQTSSLDLIGCSINELRNHIVKQWKSGMSWSNHGTGPGKWQFDHLIPCCAFDLRDLNQQKQCFHYTNLQPLWFDEHRLKTTSDVKLKFSILI